MPDTPATSKKAGNRPSGGAATAGPGAGSRPSGGAAAAGPGVDRRPSGGAAAAGPGAGNGSHGGAAAAGSGAAAGAGGEADGRSQRSAPAGARGGAPARSGQAFRGARPLGDIIGGALSTACRKRGFATVDLVSHWPDIVGPVYAETTAPDRLSWQRRPVGVGGDEHEPALLTLRCTGGVALRLTHELPQVIERINMFFGYRCVGRIKLVQLPVPRPERRIRPRPGPVPPDKEVAVRKAAEGITDSGLREAVERLGRAVAAGGVGARPITKS